MWDWRAKHSWMLLLNITTRREEDGIIINLDADTTVSNNHLNSVIQTLNENPNIETLSLHFEHPIQNQNDVYQKAAMEYELHLRYFINMQRLIKLPYAFQTIGSAMATKSNAYAKVGGMNKRQAGEDFYFMHKYSQIGTLRDLSAASVYPSCRSSDRVPFGTGKAINDILLNDSETYLSYHPESFKIIEEWIEKLLNQHQDYGTVSIDQENPVSRFLIDNKMASDLDKIVSNTSNFHSFRKRFFQWFNPFVLMKCMHYLRDNGYPNQSIYHCTNAFFNFINDKQPESLLDRLIWFREYDKKQNYYEISKDYY